MKRLILSQSRLFWILLCLGVLGRAWNLPAPIVDAMYTRQAQTADAIRSLIEEPGWQLDSNASWRGTLPARVLQELPVYNLMTQGVYEVLNAAGWPKHPPYPDRADPHLIDLSGRIVSVSFWVISFLLVQGLWIRFLSPQETDWANGVFVFAPLSVFYGQALMPEMIFLAVTVGFVLSVLRYIEQTSVVRFLIVTGLAIFGCLIKFPAFSHLGILALFLMLRAKDWKFLFRPLHFAGLVAVLIAVKLWSGEVTAVNAAYFPYWTSEESLRVFLGKPSSHFSPSVYLRIASYLTAFLLSPLGVLFAVVGLACVVRNRTAVRSCFILLWCASLCVYVVIWGAQTAGGHSYYNLPFLIPCAMLLAIGVVRLLTRLPSRVSTRVVTGVLVFGLILPMVGMSAYLFRKEWILMRAAAWIINHVPEGEPVAVKLNHRPSLSEYPHIPVVSYYSGHRCSILTDGMPEYDRALGEVRFLVETVAVNPDPMLDFATWIKRGRDESPDPLSRAAAAGFIPGPVLGSGLRIWQRPQVK